MADVVVEAAMLNGTSRGMRSVVFVNHLVGYVFGINGDSDLDYMKTTNGGLTWGAAVDVFTGSVDSFDVWYDQWTPGDTGRIIHIAFTENGTDDVSYFAFNTVNDTKTGIVDVFAGLSAVLARGVFTTVTKARGGNLYVGFDMDAFAESGFYRSVDNGVTWSAMTNPLEATIDQYMLFPANVADPNDVWLLYHDADTDELTLKEFDDSGNSFAESVTVINLIENITDITGQYGFAGTIRHSDGHLLVAWMNDFNTAGEDFRFRDIAALDNHPIATNLTTNIPNMYYPSIFINQDTGYIYIIYIGKSDGSQTLLTTASVWYALSKDGGLTWTMDIPYSTSATDYRQTWTPLSGERFMAVWMDISALSLITNHDNSKEFGFTPLNNYQSVKATGMKNTGIMSVGERIK